MSEIKINLTKFRICGVAFEGGEPFDYEVESEKPMLHFVQDDVTELCGGVFGNQVKVYWVEPYRVVIYGEGRLYLIEKVNE